MMKTIALISAPTVIYIVAVALAMAVFR